jgi:transcriptional regulator GlxA family with amidase domain
MTASGQHGGVAFKNRKIVLVAFNGMQLIDIVGPADIFDAATQLLGGRNGYELVVATPDGSPMRASGGIRLEADVALGEVQPRQVDTMIVGGGMQFHEALRDPVLAAGIQRLSSEARRTCSVCTGAFLLANVGILDGKTATTHWAFGTELARRHPRVRVQPDRIFVRDGAVATSAGVTAGMDLALALVEEDHGPEVARAVARWTVMFLQRSGGQSQFSERLALPSGITSPVRGIVDAIVAEPAGDHRLGELAKRVSISERHLRRIFAEQTKTTPAAFVERVRVEVARGQLETTISPVETIATACGFGSAETMRRAFLRVLGVGPSAYRARFTSTHQQEMAI